MEDKIMDKINKNLKNIDSLLMENGFYKYIGKIVNIENGISQLYDNLKQLQKELEQLKDNWNKLKEYCQDNSFMQNTREYGTLTVVDADELAIYMEELESGDSNE